HVFPLALPRSSCGVATRTRTPVRARATTSERSRACRVLREKGAPAPRESLLRLSLGRDETVRRTARRRSQRAAERRQYGSGGRPRQAGGELAPAPGDAQGRQAP